MPPPDLTKSHPHLEATSYWERYRAFCTGAYSSATHGVILLVAVQHFNASNYDKGWLASAPFIGLFLTPFFLWGMSRLPIRITHINCAIYFLIAIGFSLAAVFQTLPHYFWILVICLPIFSATFPLITALWGQNVPVHLRGRSFSKVSQFGMVGALIASGISAYWLKGHPEKYPFIFGLTAGVLLISAYCAFKTPSKKLQIKSDRNPLHPLSYLWKDPLFGFVCISWMFMGIGNLATLPLRIDYVSNKEYGMQYDPSLVIGLTIIIPEAVRFLSVRMWGRVFDRHNFIGMRILLNLMFALSILLHFMPHLHFQILSSILIGLGYGGGEIAWNLWVTKFATPERTADYMSVHTFLTGVRGLVGPMGAYYLLGQHEITTIAMYGSISILIACTLLLFVYKYGQPGSRLDSQG